MTGSGYDYYTYPFGPVPEQLYEEIKKDDLPVFLRGNISIIEDETEDNDSFRKFKISLKKKLIWIAFLPMNGVS